MIASSVANVRPEALDSLPDTARRGIAVRELFDGFDARQAVPDVNEPFGRPIRRQFAKFFFAAELLRIVGNCGVGFDSGDVVFTVDRKEHKCVSPLAASAAVMTLITPCLEISKRNVGFAPRQV